MASARLAHVAIAVTIGAAVSASPAAQPPTLTELVTKATDYARRYRGQLPSLVVEEEYVQNVTNARGLPATRVLRSDLVMVRLPGSSRWVTFRDVFQVDDRAIRDRGDRLMQILMSPSPTARAQAERIAGEGARFNIGNITRTINMPDTALSILDASRAARVKFDDPRAEVIDKSNVWAIRYSETALPTLVKGMRGEPLFARGRIWIEPENGEIVRTEFLIRDRTSTGRTTVDFRVDPKLGLRVPVKMSETYEAPGQVILSTATYTNIRRFTVATTEQIGKPPGD